jgi:hypothetical protein
MNQAAAYEEAIRTKVCAHCIDRTGRGICGTQQWEDCALNRFMPEIVGIVNAVKSDSLHDYVHELRSEICVSCRDNQGGVCGLRNSLECAVDRYFPLIVEAIDEVNHRVAA